MIKEEIRRTIKLEAGGELKDAHLVVHTSGVRKGKVIWICHALTANSDPQDWWPEMVGPGKTIDTEKNFIVCVNMLGSAYGSESPASINPASGKPWLLDFPKVTIRDTVTALTEVRKYLNINKIDILIGASNGGFHAIEWAVTEPALFKRCLFLCTAPRISPFLGATVEAQRMALEADPTFRQAKDLSGGTAGLKCARAQALISKDFSLYLYDYPSQRYEKSPFDPYLRAARLRGLQTKVPGRGRPSGRCHHPFRYARRF